MRHSLFLTLLSAPCLVLGAGSPRPSSPSPPKSATKTSSPRSGGIQAATSSPVRTPTPRRPTSTRPSPRAPAVPIYPTGAAAAKAQLVYTMSLDKSAAAKANLAKAKAEADPAQRRSLYMAAKAGFQAAITGFEEAVDQDPGLVGAWNELGFARRKLGDYDGALRAYARALQLDPDFLPAVEYQAEAQLGLNQLAPVRAAYMRLFREDRALARDLEGAMTRWVQARRVKPKGVAEAEVEEFAAWLGQRTQLAAQVPADGKTDW